MTTRSRAHGAHLHDDQCPSLARLRGDFCNGVPLLIREDRPLAGAPCHPEAAAAVRDIVIEQRAQRFLVDPPILGDGRGGRGKYTSEFEFHAEPRGYRKNRGEV